jgi:nucleoside-diphosphate-sugar epimerase
MNVLVTGGAGFLGQRLLRALCARRALIDASKSPQSIARIVALDAGRAPDGAVDDPLVHYVQGDLADPATLAAAFRDGIDSVFHLAAVVSGAAEADFGLGMRVNVDGTRGLLDACRQSGKCPVVVFASSVAVFGGALPAVVQDSTTPAPQSSYGVQKLIGELLVGDYSRRGYIDGRAVRLPTIVVRPGKPNAAASSFASGIIREPLAGIESVCPVARDTALWLMSPATAVDNLLRAHQISAEAWGALRAVSLPGITASVSEMLDALSAVGGKEAVGRVRFVNDERIARIVYGWPARFDAARAAALGFTRDTDIGSIVRAYAEETVR